MRHAFDPEALADRFEEARKGLELKQHDVAAAIFPGDATRRTRYNTLLRTMRKGGAPQWDVLARLVTFFASHGYHVMWLLFERGPKNILQSGAREPDLPLADAPTPTGVRLRKRR